MIFLLAQWKLLAGLGAGFALAWLIQLQIIHGIEDAQAQAIKDQITFDIKQCDGDKAKTTKAETYYETQIVALNAELNKLRKRPSTCIPIARPASSSNAADKSSKPGDGNGAVTSGALLEFAGECEIDRIKVTALQGFIMDERK